MNTSKSRVTLKTISERCGYSVNTVSRVLRGDTRLSEQTIAKIQETADELGYIRNRLASSLRSGKTNVIAILVDNIHNQHYSTVITHMDQILRSHGYDIQILCSNAEADLERHLIQIAISNSVDGIIFFPHRHSFQSAKMILSSQIPFVLVDRNIEGIRSDVVRCDDFSGGYIAGKELCAKGHRKFVYLAGDSKTETQLLRESGFLKALEYYGLGRENVRIISADDSESAILNDSMIDLLLPVDYSAILVYKDQTAYSALNSLRTAGYRVPEDISMIGFDNIRQDIPYLPPLTSIFCRSNRELAEHSIRRLLSRIENSDLPVNEEILPVSIHDGGTVSEPASNSLQADIPSISDARLTI